MNTLVYRSEDRGKANFGWLDTRYSFSFGKYYNPDVMNFGLLRVLNDDTVVPSMGFGTHPHDNMEIITIVLDGSLEHKDSMGTGEVIHKDEIQVMSAGSGITHSEFNPSDKESVKLLQIWIFPKQENIKPRYDQKLFSVNDRKNKLVPAVSGLNKEGSLYIHQNAEIYLGKFEKGKNLKYQVSDKSNGAYIFIIDGQLRVNGEDLFNRDAIGISDISNFEIEVMEDSNFIVIDVPVN